MISTRRSFLFGIGSLAVIAASAKSLGAVGQIVPVRLPKILSYRRICDICISSMPSGDDIHSSKWKEDPVMWRIYRDKELLMQIGLNPRATMRWCAMPGGDLVIPKESMLRLEVDPCYRHTCASIMSYASKEGIDMAYRENYEWVDGKVTLMSVIATDPNNAPVGDQDDHDY